MWDAQGTKVTSCPNWGMEAATQFKLTAKPWLEESREI